VANTQAQTYTRVDEQHKENDMKQIFRETGCEPKLRVVKYAIRHLKQSDSGTRIALLCHSRRTGPARSKDSIPWERSSEDTYLIKNFQFGSYDATVYIFSLRTMKKFKFNAEVDAHSLQRLHHSRLNLFNLHKAMKRSASQPPAFHTKAMEQA
jgi:hypothetical protein